jgi:hypothetical protein
MTAILTEILARNRICLSLIPAFFQNLPKTKKQPFQAAFSTFFGGPDGTRTRDLRRDRAAF